MKKAIRYLSLVIIFIFAFQSILLTVQEGECANNYAHNTKVSIGGLKVDFAASISSQASQKPFAKFFAVKFQRFCEAQVYCLNSLAKYSNQKVSKIDYRHKIASAISDYFHGSKYKGNNFIIGFFIFSRG